MATLKIGEWEKRVGIAKETAYGGALPTIARYLTCESAKFDFKKDTINKTEMGMSRTYSQGFKREQVLTPSLVLAVQPDNVGELLTSFFGTITSGTNNPATGTQYIHTFTPVSSMLDSFSSVVMKCDYGQGTAYDYKGIRGNKLTFTCGAKETLKLNYEGIGQVEVAGTSSPITLVYGTFTPFTFKDVSITIDGTLDDTIYNFELSLDNGLSDGFRLGTQPYTTRPLPSKGLEVDLKMSMEYTDVNRQRYLGGTAVGITINFVGDTITGTSKNELRISLPKVDFNSAPFEYKEGLMCLNIGGKCFEGGTSFAGTSQAVKMVLLNTLNTI